MNENYERLRKQIKGLMQDEKHVLSVLSNVTAALNEALDEINWVGFYLYDEEDDELYLGPFQGKVACMYIPMNKGVCGTAAFTRQTQVVPDVHKFPGHIACDSASNSEIVVPVIVSGIIYGVLDIDSPKFNRFDVSDKKFLEELVSDLEDFIESTL